jgi:predicted nucleotidyltransferase
MVRSELLPTSSDIAGAVRRVLFSETKHSATSGIVAVYLFGSFARGQASQKSDVDLGLLYAHSPKGTLVDQPFSIEADLSEVLGRPVQCVVMNEVPVDLVHRIMSERTLLFDLNPSHRIAFEVRARNLYFDLMPVLDRYRRPERDP